jgi:hypothetical protein
LSDAPERARATGEPAKRTEPPATWTLTVRAGGRVEHLRFDALEPALSELARRAGELARTAPRSAVDLKVTRFSPEQQVLARLELAGPQRRLATLHAGVDVHGDGSSEAYIGRIRRRRIEPAGKETAVAALRRSLDAAQLP